MNADHRSARDFFVTLDVDDRDLVDELLDRPPSFSPGLKDRRRALRRESRLTRREQAELAEVDTQRSRELDIKVTARRRRLEHRALDESLWRRLRPHLQRLAAPHAGDSAAERDARSQLDLTVLRTFIEGFGCWWITRTEEVTIPGTPEHDQRSRALTYLQEAGITDDTLLRFLWFSRYPIDHAYAEWTEEKVREARNRATTQILRGFLGKLARLLKEFSPSYLERSAIEVRRMKVARAYLFLMGSHAAPTKNSTRRRAVVTCVEFLRDLGVAERRSCQILAGLLQERPDVLRQLYRRHRT
jgi:hypothetical protein